MRDKNRLDSFYEQLKEIHKENFPDWRFGQLSYIFLYWLSNEKKIDIFFPEEDQMIELFKEFANKNL